MGGLISAETYGGRRMVSHMIVVNRPFAFLDGLIAIHRGTRPLARIRAILAFPERHEAFLALIDVQRVANVVQGQSARTNEFYVVHATPQQARDGQDD